MTSRNLTERQRDFCHLAVDYCRVTESNCWLWQYRLTVKGNYAIWEGVRVHRIMWAEHKNSGVLPDDIEVHHTCTASSCINPEHLRGMTKPEHDQEHTLLYCGKGHYIPEVGRYGNRECAECQRQRKRDAYRRNK